MVARLFPSAGETLRSHDPDNGVCLIFVREAKVTIFMAPERGKRRPVGGADSQNLGEQW
jgi:hypothetical protein